MYVKIKILERSEKGTNHLNDDVALWKGQHMPHVLYLNWFSFEGKKNSLLYIVILTKNNLTD